VVDAAAEPVADGQMGSLVVKLPLPPGCLPTLWQHDKEMVESYLSEFPGFYKTGDAGYRDADGYFYIMSRTDDIINVAGHRLSTGGMEEVLSSHKDVAECAVIGVKDELKGEVPCGFVVLKAGVDREPAEVERELVTLVRDKIGPVAAFKLAIVVSRLPKTRSGKILRGTMKKIADYDAWTMPATIDDPAILSEIAAALQRRSSRAESKLEELRNEVRTRAFQIWARRVQEGGSDSGDAASDWFAAREQLSIPPDLLL
jgi:propionyl-CoA synthetase